MCRHTCTGKAPNDQASHVVLFSLPIDHAFELFRKSVNVTDDHVAMGTVAIPTQLPENASFAIGYLATGEWR